MLARNVLLVLHILLIVSWLGIDVGVFYSSFVMRRPGMAIETRRTVRKIMTTLDLAPRVSLILMIPVALGLAYVTGLGFTNIDDRIAVPALWVIGLSAVAWAAASVRAFFRRSIEPEARWLRTFGTVDVVARGMFAAAFAALGIASLLGSGPFTPLWLGLKSLVFGVVIAAGLWIRVAAGRYRPALADLLEHGESPQRLAEVNRTIRGVYPAVLFVWSGVVMMVILAVFRP